LALLKLGLLLGLILLIALIIGLQGGAIVEGLLPLA
jgi:hypothetical protein